jgi:hypothetical protein
MALPVAAFDHAPLEGEEPPGAAPASPFVGDSLEITMFVESGWTLVRRYRRVPLFRHLNDLVLYTFVLSESWISTGSMHVKGLWCAHLNRCRSNTPRPIVPSY